MVPEVTLTLFRKIAGALEVPLGGRLTERQNRTRRGSGSAPAPREKPAAAPIRGGSPLFGRWREPRNCSRLRPSPSVEVSPGVALKVAARVRIPLGVQARKPCNCGAFVVRTRRRRSPGEGEPTRAVHALRVFVTDDRWAQFRVAAAEIGLVLGAYVGELAEAEAHRLGWRAGREESAREALPAPDAGE